MENGKSSIDLFNYPIHLSILCVGACDKQKTELIYGFVNKIPMGQIWKAKDIPEAFKDNPEIYIKNYNLKFKGCGYFEGYGRKHNLAIRLMTINNQKGSVQLVDVPTILFEQSNSKKNIDYYIEYRNQKQALKKERQAIRNFRREKIKPNEIFAPRKVNFLFFSLSDKSSFIKLASYLDIFNKLIRENIMTVFFEKEIITPRFVLVGIKSKGTSRQIGLDAIHEFVSKNNLEYHELLENDQKKFLDIVKLQIE